MSEAMRAIASGPFKLSGDETYGDLRKVNVTLLPLLVVGVLASLCVGWQANATCKVLLWTISALAVGGTVGFLFGIPRAGSSTEKRDPDVRPADAGNAQDQLAKRPLTLSRPNTNLEEVSDWLTKI